MIDLGSGVSQYFSLLLSFLFKCTNKYSRNHIMAASLSCTVIKNLLKFFALNFILEMFSLLFNMVFTFEIYFNDPAFDLCIL